MQEMSQNQLRNRNSQSLVKNPSADIQKDEDIHFEFRKVLLRFLQEFGQSPVTFENDLNKGKYKITMSKKGVLLNLEKEKNPNKFEYNFNASVLRKNKTELDDKSFVKFIQLVRKIIMDILKNDVKYY